jgi:uncharacterized protein GlcG (DUF336 family)
MITQLSRPPRRPRVASRTLSKTVAVALLLCVAAPRAARAEGAADSAAPPQPAASSPSQEIETTLRWAASGEVRRYRLQVSRDASFDDIVFDGAVDGLEQKIPLPPGTYFWRVAPAPGATGKYGDPQVILVTTPAARPPVTPKIMRPPTNVGWETATGIVDRPVAARLRAGQSVDLVAVNSEGTVYALEGASGAALWTAPFSPPRPRGGAAGGSSNQTPNPPSSIFTPVVVAPPRQGTSNVLVAFDGGVRLLAGETGRELWRVSLNGKPTGGCLMQSGEGADSTEIAVATEAPSTLYFLDPATGVMVSRAGLDGDVIGLPIPFQSGAERGVALSLKGAMIEVRRADGVRMRAVKFDVPFATPPLVISAPRATVIAVGTEHGVLFLDGNLKPLGRITTEGESPRGRLAAADLDGDGRVEIVMVTSRGRIAVLSAEGKIDWSAQGARDAFTPAFADLDRDGWLDVLAADDGVFARGFSGRDGSVIWQAGEDAKGSAADATGNDVRRLRTLAVAPGATGAPLVVGGDRARGILRAVGLPAGSLRVASR